MSREAAPLQIDLLGPLAVRVRGRTVDIPRPKQRALLAVLALSPGVCVSRERLVDELWGEAPPESAAHALQVHVSGLRKLLGGEAIATCAGGYKLDVPHDAVDVTRAEALVAAGRSERDLAKLAAAAALFQGRPLEDVDLEGAAGREAERLAGLRCEALEESFDLELAAGAGAALVAPLERLVAAEPLRERPRAQLMLALYRAGRQADALAAFQAARRTFVEELGIEPSPALREMERAILQQDDALTVAAAGSTAPGPSRGPRRARLALAVGLAVLATAAGVLASVLLPPTTPNAAPAQRTLQRTPATVVASPPPRTTTAATRRPTQPRARRSTRAKAVLVHHRRARTTAAHTLPATTTVPEVAAPVTTAPRTPPARTTTPKVATHPIATTPLPPPTTTAPPSGPVRIVDTFDGPTTDVMTWNVLLNGTGADIAQKGGRLVISIPAGSKPGGSYNFVGAQYGSKSCFAGDLDMQVDYQLIQWPMGSGAYVALQAVFANAMVERFASSGATSDEIASMIDPRFTQVDAQGTSGSLRLTRVDGVVTTYYLANGAWQKVDSAPAPHPAHLHIGLNLTPALTAASDVVVALDNFSATAYGPTTC